MKQDERAPQVDLIRLALWSQADVCRCVRCGKPAIEWLKELPGLNLA